MERVVGKGVLLWKTCVSSGWKVVGRAMSTGLKWKDFCLTFYRKGSSRTEVDGWEAGSGHWKLVLERG